MMLSLKKIKKLYKSMLSYLHKAYVLAKKQMQPITRYIKSKITSWWQIVGIVIFAIVFLYYPLGGIAINNTDVPPYTAKNENNNLYVIDTLSYLINQEVHHKMWTPNLPIFFPSYFLDDMPNFQTGILSAVSTSADGLNHMNISTVNDELKQSLNKAAELLQYPGDVWLFSPQNNLIPATSSNTQYKKARRQLNIFNRYIADNKAFVSHDAANFTIVLSFIKKDLGKLIKRNSSYIQETQTTFFDLHADDYFYYAYGKLYAYSQILKSLGLDFKETLIKYDIYPQWTSLLKVLNRAAELKPFFVRNGRLNSSFAPNHVAMINYHTSLALNHLNNILNKL